MDHLPVSMVLLTLSALLGIAGYAGEIPTPVAPANPNIHLRGDFVNCRLRFEREKKGHVAFIGGSITEMNGYRPMICEMLKKHFPQTEFTFTDAGIASTCSTTGAFRLESDVLSKGPVDLFFVEFAVNDDQDAHHTRQECIRGMEGIVRHCLKHNPAMDIVFTYFVNPEMVEIIKSGKTPLPIAAHEEVAAHYGISTVNLAQEVTEQIQAGKLTWEKFGGTHPAPFGNAICASMIEEMLSAAWKTQGGSAGASPSRVPVVPRLASPAVSSGGTVGQADRGTEAPSLPKPLDPLNYANGRFIDPAKAQVKSGWTLGVPEWKKLKGACRDRFLKVPILSAEEPGAELTLAFSGTAIGAYVLAGPDAGIIEASIDGAGFKAVELLHAFSGGLHYPRTVMFDADLAPGDHTLRLRVADQKNPRSSGHAARIIAFAAN